MGSRKHTSKPKQPLFWNEYVKLKTGVHAFHSALLNSYLVVRGGTGGRFLAGMGGGALVPLACGSAV